MNKLATRTTGIFVAMTAVLIMAFAMVMTVSAQSDTPDWRLPVTGLTVSAGDDPGELVINWDAHTQTTKTLRDYRVAWTPEGESFKGASQTNWNVYTTSTQHTVTGLDAGANYQVKVRTRYEGNKGSRWTEVVTGQTAAPTSVPEPPPPVIVPPKEPEFARSSHDVLVSNTGQTSQNTTIAQDSAQTFTTGTNTAGYVLSSIVVGYNDPDGDEFTASVWTTNTSGLPLALKHSLTAPSTFSQSDLTFTAPANATLDASTTYTVVMAPSSVAVTSKRTSTINPDEDSGAAAGWSIGDTYHFKSSGTFIASSSNKPILIAIHGTLSTLPALSFDNINITVDEDGSQAALSVELSQASADTVTVDYATSDNTAEAGDDYTDTSGTLTFAPGETVKAIIVPILDDAIYEPLERFNVTLSNPTGATLPTFPGAQVNIAVDESPPTASIANVTVGEGAGTMTLTLNLSHESSRSTPYRTQTSYIGGTATQGADYENFLSGGEARITVPAGDTQASLDITITDDTAAESSETITIRWDNDPTGGNNGDATPATINFTGTITDNDSGAQLTIQDASDGRGLKRQHTLSE